MRPLSLQPHISIRGFTFIELLMTLAILGVMVMAAVPMSKVVAQRQKEHELRAALIQIREAIDAYKRASEQGRIQQRGEVTGYPPNLEVLAAGAVDQHSPAGQRIYFLRQLPADPMVAKDVPQPPSETWALRSYESLPDDPREGSDVFDVHSKSTVVGLNGIPYNRW